MKYIYEVPVFDGQWKGWRLLNLNTGTVYSGVEYETKELAAKSIEDGQLRDGAIVKRVTLDDIRTLLAQENMAEDVL